MMERHATHMIEARQAREQFGGETPLPDLNSERNRGGSPAGDPEPR